MTTLLINKHGSRLEYRTGAVIVRVPEQDPRSVPLPMIDRIVIAGSAHINTNLFTHLAENGIGVVTMPGRHCRRNAVLQCHAHGDARRRLGQYQLAIDESARLYWARRLIHFKNIGDVRLLKRARAYRPDCRRPLTRGIEQLQYTHFKIARSRELATLRATEGAASAHFHQAYASLFAPSLGFRQRNRRPPRDPVNATLSLGYTMASAEAIAAISAAGLDPMLGLLHNLVHNRESLAWDLVELARPRITLLAWRLFAEKQLTMEHFDCSNGAARMNRAAQSAFYRAYEHHACVHRRWFERYARILARACARRARYPQHWQT